MADKTVYGAYEGGYDSSHGWRLYMTADWSTPALGATSLSVTVKTYLQATNTYAIDDPVNSFTQTVNGSSSSESNNDINIGTSGGSVLIYSKAYSLTISQTTTKTYSMSAAMSGLNAVGSTLNVSGSFTLPASGVPNSHPTVSAGTYAFGNPSMLFSFVVSGGQNYSIYSVNVKIYNARTGTTVGLEYNPSVGSITSSGTARYLSFSSTNRDAILDYWQDTIKDITRIGITVTTTYTGSTRTHDTVYITPPDIASLYSVSSFVASRGALSGDQLTTSPQTSVATVTASTSSPFHHAGVWPRCVSVKIKKASTVISTPAAAGTGANRTYTYADPATLGVTTSAVYSAELYRNTTLIGTRSFTVPAADSFITLKKGAALADHKIGIGTGNPTATLDVKGSVKFNGLDMTSGGKVLWQGVLYMSSTHTISLSEAIAAQTTGIILIWSDYQPDDTPETYQNTDFMCFFVPKKLIELHPGCAHAMTGISNASSTSNVFMKKWVYISQTTISGHAVNTADQAGVADSTDSVLRYVIGV